VCPHYANETWHNKSEWERKEDRVSRRAEEQKSRGSRGSRRRMSNEQVEEQKKHKEMHLLMI
jgi:hypothetical protein